MEERVAQGRRRLLAGGCACALGALLPASALAARPHPASGRGRLPRRIDLVSMPTEEKVSVVYWDGAGYDLGALREVDLVLRDYRTGEVRPVDPRLVELLHDLRRLLGTSQPVQVLSAYRSPQTNALMRRHDARVAPHSYHLDAKAADVRLHGLDGGRVLQAALALRRGGVGYYPRRDFVHVDTGPLRVW
jgi:uncharacterized protein YcbK (DUF882 family)